MTVIDLDESKVADVSTWRKARMTPWNGEILTGWPVMTFIEGRLFDGEAYGEIDHNGTILKVRLISSEVIEVVLHCPAVALSAKPGQFVMLRLREF